jgi:hypothetical protein
MGTSSKAWHIFYDSKNYIISNSYVVDMNAIKRITGGNEHKCTYTFNPKAEKTCEEVLEKIFIKFLKENNIELID